MKPPTDHRRRNWVATYRIRTQGVVQTISTEISQASREAADEIAWKIGSDLPVPVVRRTLKLAQANRSKPIGAKGGETIR